MKPSGQNWQQKKAKIYHQSGERVQIIGGQTGMKGMRSMKNSQFVRMQGFLKRRTQDIS